MPGDGANCQKPVHESLTSRPMSTDGYIDCMQDEIIGNLGINWSLRDYKAESYMFAKSEESIDEIKTRVIKSERVTHAVQEVCGS